MKWFLTVATLFAALLLRTPRGSKLLRYEVRGPFGRVEPIRGPYRDFLAMIINSGETEEDKTSLEFHRGHVEAHPIFDDPVFKNAFQYPPPAEGRVPLRDAVESIPVVAEAYVSRSSDESDQDSNLVPFSRADVEAFPAALPYEDVDDRQELQDGEAHSSSVVVQQPFGLRDAIESNPFRFPEDNIAEMHSSEEDEENPNFYSGPLHPLDWDERVFDPADLGSHAGGDAAVILRGASSNALRKEDNRIVCYYESWSTYRQAPFDFTVKDIDPSSCSHVIYAYVGIKEGIISSVDSELDVVKGNLRATVGLKRNNPALRVLVSVGGWEEGGLRFSQMASSQESRTLFVDSVVRFVEEFNLDGVDLNWQYPGSTDRGGRAEDKENVALLVEEIRATFEPKGWTLSMGIPITGSIIDAGYDLPRLSERVDFFNVMAFDLRGAWDGAANHHAPIAPRITDTFIHKGINLREGIEMLKSKGANPHQLVIGLPFYGRTYTLADPADNGPGAKIRSAGDGGKYTGERGYVSYFEICMAQRNGGWTMRQDDVGGAYMFNGDQWVGYDNEENVINKVQYILSEGLGGAMVWALDLDDYYGLCGRKWPLLSSLRLALETFKQEVTTTQQPQAAESSTSADPSIKTPPSASPPVSDAGHQRPPIDGQPAPEFPCQKPGYYRLQKDCRTYYVCDESLNAFTFECPEGLAFDLRRRLCNWERYIICTDGFSPLHHDFTIECQEDGLYSDPKDCRNYAWCNEGKVTTLTCPKGLFFNARTGVCTSLNDTYCIQGDMVRVPGKDYPGFSPYSSIDFRSRRSLDEYRVVCYFSNWAWFRPDPGKYVPENIDPRLCTHVMYAYSILDTSELLIRSHDTYTDFDNGFYQRILSLREKSPDVKILLSLGGWTDSATDKYSRLVNSPASRARFASHAVALLTAYGFDGLDLHWEYPVCWHMDCRRGPPSDREGFASLIKELRLAFNQQPKQFLLTAAVSPGRGIISRAYDVPTLSTYLDFINVMTYDFHGHWEKRTGHVAPLFFTQRFDRYESQNTDFAMQFWVGSGADPKKLVMGIPFYGQTYTLESSSISDLNAPTSGPGRAGPTTLQPGMMAYNEICQKERDPGWSSGSSHPSVGPFLYKGDQWVGYDDPVFVSRKAQYIKTSGFGGAMVWTIDFDDFQNLCCQGVYPLLTSINRVLRPFMSLPPATRDCTRPRPPVTPPPLTPTTTYSSGQATRPSTPGLEFFNTTAVTSRTPATVKSTTYWSSTTSSTTTTPWWVPQSTISTTATTPRLPPQDSPLPSLPSSTTTRRPPSSTATTTTSTITSTPPANRFPAPGLPDVGDRCNGNSYFAHSSDCSRFLRCVNGRLEGSFCAPGLFWSPVRKFCDWPENVRCASATKASSTSAQTTAIYTTATPWWMQPTTTATTRRTTWWTKPTSKPTPTWTTKMPLLYPATPSVKPDTHACVNGEMKGLPGDCTRFQKCSSGYFSIFSCPPGLHWNSRNNICDWPRVAKCQKIFSVRIPGGEGGTGPSEEAQCTGGYAPHPADCSKYLICNQGKYIVGNCQTPLHWNRRLNICDWAKNAGCTTSQPTSSVPGLAPVVPSIPESTPSPPPTIAPPAPTVSLVPVEEGGKLSGDFKVVCYFTNWAWYRPGIGKYTPDDLDSSLCTHIVYGFAVLDYSNLVIKPHDTWADFDNRFYERVTAYKSKGTKVTLAIGGWNDSQGDKYSRLVNSPSARRRFIDHVIPFLQKYNFDGLDLDWEYPVCWQVECNRGPKSDKEAFAQWVKELNEAFQPHGLLLSAAVSPSKKVIDLGYDVPAMNQYLDWIAVMTYDYHGQWDKKTGHVAPMYFHPDDDYDYFNMDYTIRYWLEKGASKDKIVLGMPLYGQSFTLDNPSVNGLNSPARQGGRAGEFTRASGFLAYYEICHNIKNGWNVVKDPEGRMGPYAYSGNQWVSYDDSETTAKKSRYVRDMGLAGAMVWALDLDDFNNRCGQGRHPLLNTIRNVLSASGDSSPAPPTQPSPAPQVAPQPPPPPQPTPESPSPPQPTLAPESALTPEVAPSATTHPAPTSPPAPSTPGTDASGDYKVVCYFTNWAWYRPGEGKYLPDDIDVSLCTHIMYGFAVLDSSKLVIRPHDSWADIDNRFYERVIAFKSKGVKVLVALGGWNDSAGSKYSRLANDPAARKRFNDHVLAFIQKYNFDGLDLDWEYPKCWQVDCTKGPDSDKEAFSQWVTELSNLLKPHGLLLTAAVSPNYKVIDAGYNVPVLSKYLDIISVMTYDYHGQWDKKTGHVAPMYQHPDDDESRFNADYTINYWLDKGADPKKLVMGMPMYGQSFSLAESKRNGLNQKSYGGGEAGPYTRAQGFLAYYEICYVIKNQGWNVVRDPQSTMGPYAFKGNQWVGFDDIPAIRYKSEYVRQKGLGGAMIWALDLDDFRNRCGCETHPLLRTINRILGRISLPEPQCEVFGLRSAAPPELPEAKPPEKPPAKIFPVTDTRLQDDQGFVREGSPCDPGTFAKHRDCNRFYECVHGTFQERRCFEGLHWNGQNRCDWPNAANCIKIITEEPIPTLEPPTVTSGKPTKPPATTPWWTPSTTERTRKTTTPGLGDQTVPSIVPIETLDSEYKVVCYFTNWAWYRQGIGKYKPEDIDPQLCTHIMYGFAVLDSNRLLIKPHDPWADYDNKFYQKVSALKRYGIKVLLALGGWNDSAGSKYSRLVNDPGARRRFNEHALEFIQKHNFDGLDLDWEYPKCWQVDCTKGPDSDKAAFSAWIRELSALFKPHGLLLTAAVSPNYKVIDAGYEVPELTKYLDLINVMTYDYHGHWDRQTGHVSPMFHHPESTVPEFNTNYTIHYWIEKGADRRKLTMGLPMYGQSFSLASSSSTGINTKAYGKGEAGEFTRAGGFLSYYEICNKVKSGYTLIRDAGGNIGPYAYKGNQWVGFDDVAMIKFKANWIRQMGLGGAMIWALDLDDFRNRCGCESHPLLKTINRALRGYPRAALDCTLS